MIKTFLGFQTEFLLPLMAVMITVFSRNNLTFNSSQEERCLGWGWLYGMLCLVLHHITALHNKMHFSILNLFDKSKHFHLNAYIRKVFLNQSSREKTGTRVCQAIDANIVCAGMFLKEELRAWPVVIVCERTHYWVIWASNQGLQIKKMDLTL